MIDFRQPNINSPTLTGQIAQIKSHLRQLTDELNYVIGEMQMRMEQTTEAVTTEEAESAQPLDYVLKEGKSGDWTYRKWASGRAEAWGKKTYNIIPIQTAGQYGGYYADIEDYDEFPAGLFSQTPSVIAGIECADVCWINCHNAAVPKFRICAPSAGVASNCKIYAYAVGRWKS